MHSCVNMYVVWLTNMHVYMRSCFCDASQGYSSSSTLQTFCTSFYASTTTQTNPLVTVLSNKNSVSLSGADFANLASQDTLVSLPSTYSVKVQGSLDVRAEGFYKLCVTSSEPATVCTTNLRRTLTMIYAWIIISQWFMHEWVVFSIRVCMYKTEFDSSQIVMFVTSTLCFCACAYVHANTHTCTRLYSLCSQFQLVCCAQ